MRKVLFIVLFLFSIIAKSQTTYYVAATGGDNGNAGTDVAPWATLAYAVTQASSGDEIYMQAGTHTINTTVVLPVGVSLRGAGETSIITTTAITGQWEMIISLISNTMVNGNQTISYLQFDGNDLAGFWALWIARRNNVKIHHCKFIDFRWSALIWHGDGGTESTPPDNYVTGSEFYNNDIDNCAIYDGATGNQGALIVGGQTGMLIHDNDISQTGRATGTNGSPIKVWANGGWAKGMKIYNNTLFKGDASIWDFAIEGLWMFGTEIYGNTITGSIDINHIEKDVYDYGLYAHNNTLGPISNTAQNYAGFTLEFGVSDVIIRYNLIRNCYIGILYTPRDQEVTTQDISYNIFDDLTNNGWGIAMWGETEDDFTIGTFNLYNNVFYSNNADRAVYGVGFSGYSTATKMDIINNIFVNFDNYWGIFRWADGMQELNQQNNIFYNNGGSNLPSFYSSIYPVEYNNTGNLIDNPDFTGVNDYTLQAGSPAINAGLSVGLTVDYLGATLDASPDIGAYEFGADVEPPDPPDLPSVTTNPVTSLKSISATFSGTSVGTSITDRGFAWGTSINPSVSGTHVHIGTGEGTFTYSIGNLLNSTEYHLRSFATNSEGTVYGADVSFTTPAYTLLKDTKIYKVGSLIMVID